MPSSRVAFPALGDAQSVAISIHHRLFGDARHRAALADRRRGRRAVGEYAYPEESFPPSDLWLSLVGAFLTFVWYRLDADELHYRRPIWLNFGVIAVNIIALPYYSFRSRGARRGALATLLYLLAILAWGALCVAGEYAVWYVTQG